MCVTSNVVGIVNLIDVRGVVSVFSVAELNESLDVEVEAVIGWTVETSTGDDAGVRAPVMCCNWTNEWFCEVLLFGLVG